MLLLVSNKFLDVLPSFIFGEKLVHDFIPPLLFICSNFCRTNF